jgi:hypothetical protein
MTDVDVPAQSCPYCREPVRTGARKCPHCRQWLGRKYVWLFRGWLLLLMLVPVAILALMARSFRTDDFGPYRDKLTVGATTMSYSAAKEKCGSILTVVGTIRNDSDLGWRDVYLEARFFNAAGAMIDTLNDKSYDVFVPAHAEAAFRVHGLAARPEGEYASHKVFVRSARSDRSPF